MGPICGCKKLETFSIHGEVPWKNVLNHLESTHAASWSHSKSCAALNSDNYKYTATCACKFLHPHADCVKMRQAVQFSQNIAGCVLWHTGDVAQSLTPSHLFEVESWRRVWALPCWVQAPLSSCLRDLWAERLPASAVVRHFQAIPAVPAWLVLRPWQAWQARHATDKCVKRLR